MQTVYILSGPAGVGKSTTSNALVKSLKNSAYISGDDISHMHVNGRKLPWESKSETSLIWNNILSLTKNFITDSIDVVIDYVAFPDDVKWFKDSLKNNNVNIVYVVLWTDKESLLKRDQLRIPEHRMGERCLILIEEFKQSGLENKYLLDTSENTPDTLEQIIETIINNEQFRVES